MIIALRAPGGPKGRSRALPRGPCRAPEPRQGRFYGSACGRGGGSRHMRVTVPGASHDGNETPRRRRLGDDAGTHHEAVRGLPREAAPLKGPEARAAPRGRHTTLGPISKGWIFPALLTINSRRATQ